MNYIQTQKFSDVYVSCKTMLPFKRNTISALNVLVYMMKAKTEKMDSKQKISFYAQFGLWHKGFIWLNFLWRYCDIRCTLSICQTRLD
mgnify:CR=1 FL=1